MQDYSKPILVSDIYEPRPYRPEEIRREYPNTIGGGEFKSDYGVRSSPPIYYEQKQYSGNEDEELRKIREKYSTSYLLGQNELGRTAGSERVVVVEKRYEQK